MTLMIDGDLRLQARRAGLELVQLHALRYLSLCNRYSDTSAAVADYLGLTRGTVSQTLATLERKGLLTKEGDPNDGRVSHCHLTNEGRKLVDQLVPPKVVAKAAAALPDASATTEQLTELLRHMQRANRLATFGTCESCVHFTTEAQGTFRCGLTEERLRVADSRKICREHRYPTGTSQPREA